MDVKDESFDEKSTETYNNEFDSSIVECKQEIFDAELSSYDPVVTLNNLGFGDHVEVKNEFSKYERPASLEEACMHIMEQSKLEHYEIPADTDDDYLETPIYEIIKTEYIEVKEENILQEYDETSELKTNKKYNLQYQNDLLYQNYVTNNQKTKSKSKKKTFTQRNRKDIGNNNIECKRRFVCDICSYDIDKKRLIEAHLLLHSDKDKGILRCNNCEYLTKCEREFITHISKHTDYKTFSCNSCTFKCSVRSELVIHMKTHVKAKPYVCKYCTNSYRQSSHLYRHIKSHTGEKPFSCHICNYKCIRKGLLNSHMMTHTGEKPYSCSVCPFKCCQKGNLLRHIRTHTGEKPYKCRLCPYRCVQQGDLGTHMRIHSSDRPFSCEFCDYKTRQKSSLTSHMRVHTRDVKK